ncbi:RCC1 domain-containing protein [Sandaracinus amylolyticus]|uniref:RCC1 domain-containing protein n=1 Tax=Sandaracinus amylolyticus TaxID=927083 RepID=UPI001F4184FF|nr:RCC1 domain-containing protein [Sandaracinus amylolyticus]UJR82229.1 Hypothetical protein I5071_42940 [Sandaracinus amylolyticus]
MLELGWRRTNLVLVALALVAGCGDDDGSTTPMDSGVEDAGATDGGIATPDAGRDAGADAGPSCTSGCDIAELALGSKFSCARRENGEVLCWGRGQEGQLGDGSRTHGGRCVGGGIVETFDCSPRPVIVDLPSAASSMSAGWTSICAIDADADAQCWGEAGFRIGTLPAEAARYSPQPFPMLTDIEAVAEATFTICAMGDGGAVRCAGNNGSGQTGKGEFSTTELSPVPVQRAEPAGTALTGALEVVLGTFSDFACARTADEVLCWGSGEAGQLATDPAALPSNCATGSAAQNRCTSSAMVIAGLPEMGITQLAAGGEHVCALLEDQTVVCWGANDAGQLGTGDRNARIVPTAVTGLSGVTRITTGGSHTCAVLSDGGVRCWGYNRFGQLGDGDESHEATACRIADDDSGDCSSTPVAVMGVDDATFVDAGVDHTCIVRAEGTEVWCWGRNDMLQTQGSATFSPTPDEVLPRHAPVQVTGL